jgi:hypothetical protein
MEQMIDIYGVAIDVHLIRTFNDGHQLGAGYDIENPTRWFVYHRGAGPVGNGQWDKHCGPMFTFEEAKDWILAIREE